jgi:uncharacterized protein
MSILFLRRPRITLSKYLTHPLLRPSFSTTRKMSTMHEFLVQIPDMPNALNKRLGIRPTHLANLKPHIDSGKVVFGGATLSKPVSGGEAPDMTGSVMLIKAESQEEVVKFLEGDAYAKGGAWDVKNAKITPFRCAIRTAM